MQSCTTITKSNSRTLYHPQKYPSCPFMAILLHNFVLSMTESGGVGDRVRESPLDPLPVSLGPKPSHSAEHDLQAKPLPGRDLAGGSGHPKPHPYLSRWIKFEEKVEEGGERWSKPHVSTLSLHSLFELRTCLQTGTVLLDLDSGSLPQIIGEAGTAVGPPNWAAFPLPAPISCPPLVCVTCPLLTPASFCGG